VTSEKRQDWGTPRPLWLGLHQEFRFNLDAAASAENALCLDFYDGSEGLDGLVEDWENTTWCNPPYNPTGEIRRWLEKALRELARGVRSVLLIPMASSRGYFNDIIIPYTRWWTFNKRIAFVDPVPGAKRTQPKQDNVLVCFDPRADERDVGHQGVRDSKTGQVLWASMLDRARDVPPPPKGFPVLPLDLVA